MNHLSKEELEGLVLSDATTSEKKEALEELLERAFDKGFEEGKQMILQTF